MDDLEQELWSPKDLEEDNYSSDNNSTTGRTQPSLPLANPMCVGELDIHFYGNNI